MRRLLSGPLDVLTKREKEQRNGFHGDLETRERGCPEGYTATRTRSRGTATQRLAKPSRGGTLGP